MWRRVFLGFLLCGMTACAPSVQTSLKSSGGAVGNMTSSSGTPALLASDVTTTRNSTQTPNSTLSSTMKAPPLPPKPGSFLHESLAENKTLTAKDVLSAEVNKPFLTAKHRSGSGGGYQVIQTGNNNNNMASLLPLLAMMNTNTNNGRQDAGGQQQGINPALLAMMASMMSSSNNNQQVIHMGGHSD